MNDSIEEGLKEMAELFLQLLDYEYEATTPKQIYGCVKY